MQLKFKNTSKISHTHTHTHKADTVARLKIINNGNQNIICKTLSLFY